MAEDLQRVGWIVSCAIAVPGDTEPCEYILDWPHDYAPPFREHSLVEVGRVTELSSTWLATEGAERAPLVGDIGTVVHCYPFNGRTIAYEVECVDSAGETIWVATFEHDSLKQATV